MKRIYLYFTTFFCILAITCCGSGIGEDDPGKDPDIDPNTPTKPQVGKVLPDWSDGYLDIHAINTGRGECTLLILPDGTTMLVDASSSAIAADDAIPPPPAKPNASADSGETISNYVSHFIEAASGKLNYIMVTHWHADHVGGDTSAATTHPAGQFKMFGLTKVAADIKFDKIIDRGISYPRDLTAVYSAVANYVKFVDWSKSAYSAEREEFKVGSASQIVLKENAAKYSNFQVRNIVGNGVVWTGEGTATRNTFPDNPADVVAAGADENIFSLGFHLKYGMFDYFSGADLQYTGRSTHSWFDIEAPVAGVMQRVEVLKANHHGTNNCNSDTFLNRLRPQAVLIHVWRDVQPHPSTIDRMFAANSNCQIFTTNMTTQNMGVLGSSVTSKIKSMNGHIVVRVDPGGQRYYIYVLDDTNEDYKVQKIFGPYQCN